MQQLKWLFIVGSLFLFLKCQPEQKGFLIQAQINGGAGKYIKVIDMTMPGLGVDSIELDLAGRFQLGEIINQPHDYVFYFKPEHSIRITPLPEEQITISGNVSNLVKSYTVSGSPSSEKISHMLKKQQEWVVELDSVEAFYMQNQLNPNVDSIISTAQYRSDSIYNAGKRYLQNQIKDNPGSMSSYVALAQKLDRDLNFFTIENDFEYFEMVDTALTNRFDSSTVVNMLHAYVVRGKQMQLQKRQNDNSFKLGQLLPDIALPNPYGDTLLLSSLKGKYVLIDFWGSWCRPCRLEHPNLRKAYLRYRRKGFDIYQVALERSLDDWKNTIREDKLSWKNQVSELNYMESKVARQFQIKSLPSNYLIDPEGKLIAKDLYGEALLQKLATLFPPVRTAPKPKPIVEQPVDTIKSE